MRAGRFQRADRRTGRRITLYDPWTTDSKTWQRQPFPSNVIPLARRSPRCQVPVERHTSADAAGREPAGRRQLLRPDRPTTRANTPRRCASTTASPSATRSSSATPSAPWTGCWAARTAVRRSRWTAWPTCSGDYIERSRLLLDSHLLPTFFSETLVNFGPGKPRRHVSGDPNVKWADKLGLAQSLRRARRLPQVGSTGFAMTYVEGGNTQGDFSDVWSVDQNFTKVMGRHELQFGGAVPLRIRGRAAPSRSSRRGSH